MDNKSEMHRSGIRKSLLSGLSTLNSTSVRGGLTDEENAKSLAKRLFEGYNKDQSEEIADYELSSMMTEVYKAIGKEFTPTADDVQQYSKVLDMDKDGKVSQRDIEKLLIKYLV